jgi:hypothetical protein
MRIDLQGLFTKAKALQDQIDQLRSLGISKREGASTVLPTDLREQFLQELAGEVKYQVLLRKRTITHEAAGN